MTEHYIKALTRVSTFDSLDNEPEYLKEYVSIASLKKITGGDTFFGRRDLLDVAIVEVLHSWTMLVYQSVDGIRCRYYRNTWRSLNFGEGEVGETHEPLLSRQIESIY